MAAQAAVRNKAQIIRRDSPRPMLAEGRGEACATWADALCVGHDAKPL